MQDDLLNKIIMKKREEQAAREKEKLKDREAAEKVVEIEQSRN